jgi:hypothetical protein
MKRSWRSITVGLFLTQCSSEPPVSHDDELTANAPKAQDIKSGGENSSESLMSFVESSIVVPCTLVKFSEEPSFKALLTEDGNVGPAGLSVSISGIEFKPGESIFVLQPPFMAERYDAIYFSVTPTIGLTDLIEAIRRKDTSVTVQQIAISPSDLRRMQKIKKT